MYRRRHHNLELCLLLMLVDVVEVEPQREEDVVDEDVRGEPAEVVVEAAVVVVDEDDPVETVHPNRQFHTIPNHRMCSLNLYLNTPQQIM